MPTIRGVIHGKTIELERKPGLPDGLRITVELRPLDGPPAWLERFAVDPAVRPGKFAIKGTHLLVDDLVQLVEDGRTDDELRQAHPELAAADVDAVRNYARVPEAMRRSRISRHRREPEFTIRRKCGTSWPCARRRLLQRRPCRRV